MMVQLPLPPVPPPPRSTVVPSAPSKNPFYDDDDVDDLSPQRPLHSPTNARSSAGSTRARHRPAAGGSGLGDSPTEPPSGPCQRCSNCCFKCTARCTRVLLVGPNLLFLLFGATLVGLGVWMRADRESPFYIELLRSIPASPILTIDQLPIAVIAVGGCVAVLSFLGCCGACFESICFLCMYTLFLVLMVTAEIVLGVVIAVMHEELMVKLATSLQHQIRYDYNRTVEVRPTGGNVLTPSPPPPVPSASYVQHLTLAWDTMHTQFSCCGAVGPQDFMKSAWFNRSDVTGVYVPGSCCVDRPTLDTGGKQVVLSAAAKIIDCQLTAERYIRSVNKPDGPDPSLAGGLHFLQTQGCKQSLHDLLNRHLSILISVGCAIIILQVVDFGFACMLMSWFRKKQAEYSWYDDEFD